MQKKGKMFIIDLSAIAVMTVVAYLFFGAEGGKATLIFLPICYFWAKK